MTMKRLVIPIAAITLLAAAVFGFLQFQQSTTPQPSDDAFLQAITQRFPEFEDDNTPVIAIETISRHDYKWYIVTIKSIEEVENFVPVKLILLDSKDGLSIKLGPDTGFAETELESLNMPESAILEL